MKLGIPPLLQLSPPGSIHLLISWLPVGSWEVGGSLPEGETKQGLLTKREGRLAGSLWLPSPCPSPWLRASLLLHPAGTLHSEAGGGCKAIVGQAASARCWSTGEVDLRNHRVPVRQALLEWRPPPSLHGAGSSLERKPGRQVAEKDMGWIGEGWGEPEREQTNRALCGCRSLSRKGSKPGAGGRGAADERPAHRSGPEIGGWASPGWVAREQGVPLCGQAPGVTAWRTPSLPLPSTDLGLFAHQARAVTRV